MYNSKLLNVLGFFIMCAVISSANASGVKEVDSQTKKLAELLKKDVNVLAEEIGPRNMANYESCKAAGTWIEKMFRDAGYQPMVQEYKVAKTSPKSISGLASVLNYSFHLPFSSYWNNWPSASINRDKVYKNISVELKGITKPEEIIVIGAHYDSAPVNGCAGADDNASGIASVIELARQFSNKKFDRTIRFVAFANEEPPFFQTNGMGSYVYAKECKDKKENIVAMISMESIGYYSDKEDSQKYPPGLKYFYPRKGNFIALLGNRSSSKFVKYSAKFFRENVNYPYESAALPQFVPGVSWSDQWAFWKFGYSAIMVTDTAPFRNKNYHHATDSLETLDFEKMAVVVDGVGKMLEDMSTVMSPK